ncbi:bacteriocin [Chryseobacterium gleum]
MDFEKLNKAELKTIVGGAACT